jgi:nicotinamide mononucleotide transporter
MDIQQWVHLFWQQVLEADLLQWLAVILGVAEVFLAKANKIALYPTGIAATLISIYILFTVGLYAECLLNGYYVVMSVYGWWHWADRKQSPVKVSSCNKREWTTVLAIVFIGLGLLYFILRYYTPSTVPLWDAWVTATAWAGMWLLAKRKIENWILLNVSNAFAIPLLIHKELPLFSVLTLILFVVAIFGFFEWRKILRREGKDTQSLQADKSYSTT